VKLILADDDCTTTVQRVGSVESQLQSAGVQPILDVEAQPFQPKQPQGIGDASLYLGANLLIQPRVQPGQFVGKNMQSRSPTND
jgi:hypothetical protein